MAADLGYVPVGEAESEEPLRDSACVAERFGHGARQAADDLVLLDDDDAAGLAGGGDNRLIVERLDGVHADDPTGQAGPGELFRRGDDLVADGPGEDERQILAVSHLNRLAEPKVDGVVVDRRLLLVATAVVYGTLVLDHGPCGGPGLGEVARTDHHHVGKRPHDGDVFRGLMGDTQRAVGESAADDDDLHVRIVIADVISYLLERPERREVGNGVGDGDVAFHGDATGDSSHILFGHAYVEVTFREGLGERLDFAIADVRQDQEDAVVLAGQLQQHFVE